MKFLLFFHGSSLNRGAEAIIHTASKLIKKKYPDSFVGLASRHPESDHVIPNLDEIFLDGYDSIKPYSINWLISAISLKIFKSESFALRKIKEKIIKRIPDFDYFLSTGGDNYCYGEQPDMYEVDRQIKKRGKKLVLWGASICENDLSTDKINDLMCFDLILARETYTYKLLKKLKFSNVKLVGDGAFLLEKKEVKLPKEWKVNNIIGFNYSPLVFEKNHRSKEAVIQLIEYILETTNLLIVFTPHVTQAKNNDYEVLHEFYTLFKNSKRVMILPDDLTSQQYKGYISNMRFFIGARTHATIAAYSSIVPTMVLGYSVKSRGIAYDIFGEEKLVLHLNEISDSSKLKQKFDELIRDEIQIRSKLNDSIPIIKKRALKAVDHLNEILR